jgi:hypothetical protein
MKIFIAMKTLGWSGVSNTPKLLCYLANYGIQNKSFYMQIKHLPGKNIMVFLNIMVLS